MFVFDSINFLENYKLHPCLWDKKHVDFKNRESRVCAENILLPISGLPSLKQLRAKIRSLRCTYNQEVNKLKASLRSGEKAYRPKLQWFALADSFLKKNREDEEAYIDFELNATEDSQSQNEEIMSVNYEHDYVMKDDIPVLLAPECTIEVNSEKQTEKVKVYSKRVKTRPFLNNLMKPVSKLNTPEEFAIFGQHVATQLSKLPLNRALKLQEEIQRLITKARISAITTSDVPEARIQIPPIFSSEVD